MILLYLYPSCKTFQHLHREESSLLMPGEEKTQMALHMMALNSWHGERRNVSITTVLRKRGANTTS